jgi:ADP-heptose:LPS heptosyltransferase
MKRTEFPLKAAFIIRKEKYDIILDLWSNPRSAQITFLSGVKYRVGYAYRGRKYAYNIFASSDRGAHHSAEHNLELLKALEVPVISKKIYFTVSESDNNSGIDFIKRNFAPGTNIAGIIPSGGWPSKRCDAVKWVEICKALNEKYKMRFLILWGPGDEQDSEFINNKLPDMTVLAPATSIVQMAGLINNCDLIIANDSGPMHIAAALGVPTLGLFGPTDPKFHGPYSENSDYVIKEDLFCIICNKTQCPYKHECFVDMSVESVVQKAGALMPKFNKV